MLPRVCKAELRHFPDAKLLRVSMKATLDFLEGTIQRDGVN